MRELPEIFRGGYGKMNHHIAKKPVHSFFHCVQA